MAAETLVYEFYEKPFQYDDIDDSPYVVNRKAISVDQVSSEECIIFLMTLKWKLVERVKVMNYNGLDNYVQCSLTWPLLNSPLVGLHGTALPLVEL